MALPAESYPERRDSIYRDLMSHARGLPNDATLACICATWASGGGALPDFMGLATLDFHQLLVYHFPGAVPLAECRGVRAPERADEMREIRALLLHHRAGQCPSEIWVADIVTTACMAGNHLWQDLGLWSRRQLSELMTRNFPTLAAQNVKDMKWKKFLYRQLCTAEGIHVCRAPSCDACIDYPACFGRQG